MKMKKTLKPIFSLFTGLQLFLYLLLIFTLSTGFLYMITRSVIISIVLGLATMLALFYFGVFIPKKVKRHQYLLKELQKYATNMTFYMQSGYNIPKALENARIKLDKEIQADIDLTIEGLQKDAALYTDHFKRYNFYSIDIFHQILQIKYDKGGNTKELFTEVNKTINFELVKQDELYRRKQFMKQRIQMLIGMAMLIPSIMVFSAASIYETFLSMGILAIGINVVLYIGILITLFFLQRASAELSLQY